MLRPGTAAWSWRTSVMPSLRSWSPLTDCTTPETFCAVSSRRLEVTVTVSRRLESAAGCGSFAAGFSSARGVSGAACASAWPWHTASAAAITRGMAKGWACVDGAKGAEGVEAVDGDAGWRGACLFVIVVLWRESGVAGGAGLGPRARVELRWREKTGNGETGNGPGRRSGGDRVALGIEEVRALGPDAQADGIAGARRR